MDARCNVDEECPAGLLCYAHASWNTDGPPCLCSTWYGKTGTDCAEFTGPTPWLLLFIGSASLLVIAIFAVMTIRSLAQYLAVFGKCDEVNATVSTMVFTLVAMLGSFVSNTAYLVEMTQPWTEENIEVFKSGYKEHWMHGTTIAGLVTAQVFTFLMMLNLSVMWVEVSQTARNMDSGVRKNVTRYRWACVVTGMLFILALSALAALDLLSLSTLIMLPFTLGVFIVILMGRRGMTKVLKASIAHNPVQAGTGPTAEKMNEDVRNIQQVLSSIARFSKYVLITIVVMVTSGVSLSLLMMMHAGGWKEATRPGQLSVPAILARVTTLCLEVMQVLCAMYCRESVRKAQLSRRQLWRTIQSTTKDLGPSFISEVPPQTFAQTTHQ